MKTEKEKLVATFSELGKVMVELGQNAKKEDINPFISDFYDKINEVILREKAHNGWFTEESVRLSLYHLGKRLNEKELSSWLENTEFTNKPKNVGIIMAGNLPLVGFHDFLSVLMTGHNAIVKMSSDDNRLLPQLIEILEELQPELTNKIKLVDRLNNIDAVIATGNNNSARYFEKYFGHLPNIIRKNRTSLAVLKGDESKDDLKALGKDIFTYFGMGCRNVSQLLIPKDFNMDHFFEAIIDFGEVVNHHKYANNYDYHKAIYLMNQEKIIENGFVLTKEEGSLFAPVSVLLYHRYKSTDEVDDFIEQHENQIQVVVGKDYTPFGKAQSPKLDDYADGVNTLDFLTNKL
ncbi:MAG: acyl-CoA reductase [Brumimicrobium sp.]